MATPERQALEAAMRALVVLRAQWRAKVTGPRWPRSGQAEVEFEREHRALTKALDDALRGYLEAEVEAFGADRES